MEAQTKQCNQCQASFVIEPDDFAFYSKIDVPAPTWCPNCRSQRRLSFMNLFNMYRRTCDLCGQAKMSMYAPDAPYKVYCTPCWSSDKWDPLEYGQDYDFNRPFFEQFDEFLHKVPLLGLSQTIGTMVNSEHTNYTGHMKDSYLIFYADYNEECRYGFYHTNNKRLVDCTAIGKSEMCFDTRNGFSLSKCIGCINTTESVDCQFMRDSQNCTDCFGSANIRNGKYVLFNKEYSDKASYEQERNKWDLGSYQQYQDAKQKAQENFKQHPPWPIKDRMSVDSTGNYVFDSKNCKECYEVMFGEDSKYLFMIIGKTTNSYDVSGWGDNMDLAYECAITGEDTARMKFCFDTGIGSHDCEYCFLCFGGGTDLFGCVSIRKGQYRIFNKQYTKEEYEALVPKIKEHMRSTGEYGQFFPARLSPFGYNETLANNFFPLSEQEIKDKGLNYRPITKGEHKVTLPAADLPDHIEDAQDDILNEVIGCDKCERGFKLIAAELQFLRQMNVPLPRQCPFCRIEDKFNQWVKQLQLTDRTCSICSAEFKTPYTEDEYPTIWCPTCYKQQIL